MTDLPTGWHWSTLGDECTKPQYGYTSSSASAGEHLLLRTTDITKGSINWENVPYCTDSPAEPEKYLLKPNDIVVSRAGSVGFSRLVKNVPHNAVFASYLIRFRPLERLLPEYMAYFLQSPGYWEQVGQKASGITIANINAKQLQAMALPVPPLEEQQRIVNILDDHFSRLDAAEVSAQSSIRKCDILDQSLLHALYGDAAALCAGTPDMSLNELAESGLFVDGDWVESKDQDPAGGIRLTQLADVGVGKFLDRSRRYLRQDQADRLKVTALESGDLLIARMPDPLGRAALVPDSIGPAITVVDVAILRIRRDEVVPRFVMWLLNSPEIRSRMLRVSSGTTRLRISRKNLGQISVPLPTVSEQVRLADELESRRAVVEVQRQALTSLLAASSSLRRSLLHSAFTGDLTKEFRNG